MELQEAFDTVVTHLYTQKKRAFTSSSCLYRTPEGLKCAAGCLIPDELYDIEMEGAPFYALNKYQNIVDHFNNPWLNNVRFVDLIQRLQDAHDDRESWNDEGPNEEMYENLIDIASKYKLNTEVLEKMVKGE